MLTSTLVETSVKIVQFSGKKAEWDSWLFGFEGHAVISRYEGIISDKDKVPTKAQYDAIDSETQDKGEKKKLQLYHANSLAFSHLVTSMDPTKDGCKVTILLLRTCKSGDYPHGNAAQAIKMLNGHFNIKSVATAQKLLNNYHEKELKNGQDPAVFVAAMQTLRLKIADADKTQKIEDRAFILHILNKLPESYETMVELIEKDINSNNMRTIDSVLEKLVLRFQRIQGRNKSGSLNGGNGKSGEDVTLYAGGFKGKCNNCSKYGHKANQCHSGAGGHGGCGGRGDQSSGRGGSAGR
jgi:gag-polypeptide of LTR copia-type